MGTAIDLYQIAEIKLQKCAKEEALMKAVINSDVYPWRVTFYPDDEISIFDKEQIDGNGELKRVTVTVGVSLTIESTLEYKLDASVLKKLISLSDKCGTLFSVAYREQEAERLAGGA